MARSSLDGRGLPLLSEKYPAYPVARLFGDAAKPLPVWAELAPAEQWQDIEAPLGRLDLSEPVPDVRTWRYWEPCDPRGEEEFKRHLDEWDRQLREVHAGRREHLKTWISSPTTRGDDPKRARPTPAGLQARDLLPLAQHVRVPGCGAERGICSLARLHP